MFDLDGLLVDSERKMWDPNMIKVFKGMNYDIDMTFLRKLKGLSRKTSAYLFYEKFGNDFDVEGFYDQVYELNNEAVKNNKVPLMEGAKEVINFLKENNIDLCVGTSSDRNYVTHILNNCGVLNDFQYIVCGNEVKAAKPNPDIYLKCMSYYTHKPEECLVLEDAHSGAQAAVASGAKCCLVPGLGFLTDWDYENCFIVNKLIDTIDIIKQE